MPKGYLSEESGEQLSSSEEENNNEIIEIGERMKKIKACKRHDVVYGYEEIKNVPFKHTAWLINIHSSEVVDENKRFSSCLDMYFIDENNHRFKISYVYHPYFYVSVVSATDTEVLAALNKRYPDCILNSEICLKDDLDLINHLAGIQSSYMKLSFINVSDLLKVRRAVISYVRKNGSINNNEKSNIHSSNFDPLSNITDLREYDVPYHIRVCIDKGFNTGRWYDVCSTAKGDYIVDLRNDMIQTPEAIIMAFDIETTKLPLKFPDSSNDCIMMISYMIGNEGYLITNREIISENIDNFEYSPRPEFETKIDVFNAENEYELLKRWFKHIVQRKPIIYVTYNGDFFDWPFIETRAKSFGLNIHDEIGVMPTRNGSYKCYQAINMDCLNWVKRDSYLPMGSQGLKSVTKTKLRYDPVEVDPEKMLTMAKENPRVLSAYSVSDSVATYYLYLNYVHPFILALCTIIPMDPDEVLRKGSGTLCESLLMVQAMKANIIFPNKHNHNKHKFTSTGNLLETETYVGGHVEAIESGIFRNDIPCRFRMNRISLENLMDNIEETIKQSIETEHNTKLHEVINFNEICLEIKSKLASLHEVPLRIENPLIYHLDVGAMYPNIILTNRLQPTAIVDDKMCASCDFNVPGSQCQKKMNWNWRGTFLSASYGEFQSVKRQLEVEKVVINSKENIELPFSMLSDNEKFNLERKRLIDYSKMSYKTYRSSKEEIRNVTVCQKENSFYVDTVRAFRDRRNEFKDLLRHWKKQYSNSIIKRDDDAVKKCKSMEVIYDSLQLAHKCILNSFYGYVMRKGSRWFSMEMAGVVCYTGSNIIKMARELIDDIGRPLELDTDGIWCALPSSFPENFQILTNNINKPKFNISYPGAILNYLIRQNFTNIQYHHYDAITSTYRIQSENSIFFEVDGPYQAMFIPASKEEGKMIKKRYAVFNLDGSIAELKGFEIKRRGELHLIKIFQSSLFECFLFGDSLETCYKHLSNIANYWLDILISKARNLTDEELVDLISENRNMSKRFNEYANKRSTAITTAVRLSEFLGKQILLNPGLNCRYVISNRPVGAVITDRAIPVLIFQADPDIKAHFLRKWLSDDFRFNDGNADLRDIIDWDYYIERLNSCIQKLITIPASMQGLKNPVERCPNPTWVKKTIGHINCADTQKKITDLFAVKKRPLTEDIEDINLPHSDQLSNKLTKQMMKNVKNDQRHWKVVFQDEMKSHSFKNDVIFLKKRWGFQVMQRKNIGHFIRNTTKSFPINLIINQTMNSSKSVRLSILKIDSNSSSDHLKFWIYMDKKLISIPIRIYHQFYVASNTKIPELDKYKLVNKILPRSKNVNFLYEIQVSYSNYQKILKQVKEYSILEAVKGLYESQISRFVEVLVKIGSYNQFTRNGLKNFKLINEIELTDILTIDDEINYGEISELNYFFLYFCKSDSFGVFSLFNTHNNKAIMFILMSGKENMINNLEPIYESYYRLHKTIKENVKCILPDKIEFEVKFIDSFQSITKNMHKVFSSFKSENVFVILISSIDLSILVNLWPFIDRFLIYELRKNLECNKSIFNTIDWQSKQVKSMIKEIIISANRFESLMVLASFFNIPVGNIPSTSIINDNNNFRFVFDMAFTRFLHNRDFITWYSINGRADFGNMGLVEESWIKQYLTPFAFRKSGFYHTLTLEFMVEGLEISSILMSNKLLNQDGSFNDSTTYNQPFHKTFMENYSKFSELNEDNIAFCDETTMNLPIIKHLKSFVVWLINNINKYSNIIPFNYVSWLYEWFMDRHSALFDPAIAFHINNSMRCFMELFVDKLKKYGLKVIYYDLKKIIINSPKPKITDSWNHIRYSIEKIIRPNSNDRSNIFCHMKIEPKSGWYVLFWLNEHNNGGIRFELPNDADFLDADSVYTKDPNIEMNWRIVDSIDPLDKCASTNTCKLFNSIISKHIYSINQIIINWHEIHRLDSVDDQLSRQNFGSLNSLIIEHNQNRISNEIADSLYIACDSIRRTSLTIQNGLNEIALLIDAIFTILQIDVNCSNQINKLRREISIINGLKKNLNNDQPILVDLHSSFILPQVFCALCGHCRDVDVCSDLFIKKDFDNYNVYCNECIEPYKKDYLESLFMYQLNLLIENYLNQDFKCLKCKSTRYGDMQNRCECSYDFILTENKSIFKDRLSCSRKVIKIYQFVKSEEILDFIPLPI